MMVFSMRSYKNALDYLLPLLLSWALCASHAVWADEIGINKAELRQNDAGYYLSANYNIQLNDTIKEALLRGVPLYFVSEFRLNRDRWYWLDEEIFNRKQISKLSYNVLTRQFRVSRGNLFRTFKTMEQALAIVSIQSSTIFPPETIRDSSSWVSSMLDESPELDAAVRLYLDPNQLPKLLQVNAFTSSTWTLDSGWHHWTVKLPQPPSPEAEQP